MTSPPPMVLQVQNVKIAGVYRNMFSNQIVTLDRAKQIIAANYTSAQALGYTASVDANDYQVTYTETVDPPNVTIVQYFIPFGRRYINPISPITGEWESIPTQSQTPRPTPQMKTIDPPSGIGTGTDIIAVFGQSNSGGSGEGRFNAQVPTPVAPSQGGGTGGYCWNNDLNAFMALADPLGGGNDGQGYDAGPWARLCAKGLGQTIP